VKCFQFAEVTKRWKIRHADYHHKQGTEMIVAKKPTECLETELKDFAALILVGGEVTAVGLEARIKKAEALLFLVQDSCLKGIAAVKNPEKGYRQGVFQKAQATIEASEFPFELGWVYVLPSSRGSGFSHKLVEAALSVTNGQAVFATSRADNELMHKVLKAHSFSCHGKTYASTRGNQQLALFVCNASQQGAPGDAPKAAPP
jgi:GNAT superfamily N-acetyltransferase